MTPSHDKFGEPGDEQPFVFVEMPAGEHSDADLMTITRDGPKEVADPAEAELFRRHHPAALAFARSIGADSAAQDLVAECFTKLLGRVRTGRFPSAFRAYLFTMIRHAHYDQLETSRREILVADAIDIVGIGHTLDPNSGPSTSEEQDDRVDRTLIAQAFRSLPDRWQQVLWRSTVDDEPLEAVGRSLGMNANSAAALNFRAREGLRRAYLEMHLAAVAAPECEPIVNALPAYVRGVLPPRRADTVKAHIAQCPRCTDAHSDLATLNANFAAVLTPLVIAAAGSHSGIYAGSGLLGTASTAPRLRAARPRVRSALISATAVAVSVTALVTAAVLLTEANGDSPTAHAAPPGPTSTSAPTAPQTSLGRPQSSPRAARTPKLTTTSPTSPAAGQRQPTPEASSRATPSGQPRRDSLTTANVNVTAQPSGPVKPSAGAPSTPSSPPAPTPTPTPTPDADLRFGVVDIHSTAAPSGAMIYTVSLPVTISTSGAGRFEVEVVVRLDTAGQFILADSSAGAGWSCRSTSPDQAARATTCVLADQAPRTTHLAFDVVTADILNTIDISGRARATRPDAPA